MSAAMDHLEERVNAVVGLVRHLRQEVARLERQLAACPAPPHPREPDGDLLAEVSRLREERAAVRELIRGLIHEIDQVPG